MELKEIHPKLLRAVFEELFAQWGARGTAADSQEGDDLALLREICESGKDFRNLSLKQSTLRNDLAL